MPNVDPKKTLALALTLPIAIFFAVSLPLDTLAAPPLLPPRPEVQQPQPPPPDPWEPPDRLDHVESYAFIDSRVQLGTRQKVWTVIQRQVDGSWRDIVDWSGDLDSIANGAGKKISMVFPPRFGWGPLRVMVYESAGGRTIGESISFYAPTTSNQTVIVGVTTTP